MVIAELIITLDKGSFRPGEPVSGEVRIRLDENHPCRLVVGLRLGLSPLPGAITLLDKKLPARRWLKARFSLLLPSDAPLSVEGLFDWSVTASARMPFAFDETVETPIEVRDPDLYPHVLPLEVAATRSGVSSTSPVAVPGLLHAAGGRPRGSLAKDLAKLGAGTMLLGVAGSLITVTKGAGIGGGLLLSLPGLSLSRPALRRFRRFLAEHRIGVVRVAYESVLDDEAARLALQVYLEPALDEGELRARLRVERLDPPPDAEKQAPLSLHFDEIRLARASTQGLYEGSLALPKVPVQSGRLSPGVRLAWNLDVVIELPRWPDWVETFPLEVVPRRRSATSAKST